MHLTSQSLRLKIIPRSILVLAFRITTFVTHITCQYLIHAATLLYCSWTVWQIQMDVAGATFMAAGSSAPEFFAAVIGKYHKQE